MWSITFFNTSIRSMILRNSQAPYQLLLYPEIINTPQLNHSSGVQSVPDEQLRFCVEAFVREPKHSS